MAQITIPNLGLEGRNVEQRVEQQQGGERVRSERAAAWRCERLRAGRNVTVRSERMATDAALACVRGGERDERCVMRVRIVSRER